jgi:hypothetical protein
MHLLPRRVALEASQHGLLTDPGLNELRTSTH